MQWLWEREESSHKWPARQSFVEHFYSNAFHPPSLSRFPPAALQHSSASPSTETHTPVESSSNPVRTQQSYWTPSNGEEELREHS